MADEEKKTGEVTVRVAREFAPVQSHVPIFDTSRFEHICRVANAIAAAPMLPTHLQGKSERETVGNCVLIVSKALAWNMDPFDVAMSTAVVHGKLCYEGKLISAMLEGNHGVRLHYEWNDKSGDAFGITVRATRPGDDEPVEISGTVGDWKTMTNPKEGARNQTPQVQKQWQGSNARRQLAYRGAREWARIYMPSAILGIYAPDEIEAETYEARQAREERRAPAISASFTDEPEQPDKIIDAEVIEPEEKSPDPEPKPEKKPAKAKEKAKPKAKEKPAPDPEPEPDPEETEEESPAGDEGELDLSDGEPHEESPFDPDPDGFDAEAEEGEDNLESEADLESEGEEDLSSESQAEPEEPRAITTEDLERVRAAESFAEARTLVLQITKGERFAAGSAAARDEVRRELYALLVSKPEAKVEHEDPIVFRLWIPVCDNLDELEEAFAALEETKAYKDLREAGRQTLQSAASNRIAEISGLGG